MEVNVNSWHYKQLPLMDRIKARTTKVVRVPELGECWEYGGFQSKEGYGRIKVNRQQRFVHKLAWEALNGPVPAGLQLDHKCTNEPCWRPDHLRVATPLENSMASESPAAKNAVKTHCLRGHEFTEANTRIYTKLGRRPERVCRTCQRERRRAKN